MPLFTYRCEECGKQFEALVFSGDNEPKCPECNSEKTVRDFSGMKGFSCGNGNCSGSCATCKGCHH